MNYAICHVNHFFMKKIENKWRVANRMYYPVYKILYFTRKCEKSCGFVRQYFFSLKVEVNLLK